MRKVKTNETVMEDRGTAALAVQLIPIMMTIVSPLLAFRARLMK